MRKSLVETMLAIEKETVICEEKRCSKSLDGALVNETGH